MKSCEQCLFEDAEEEIKQVCMGIDKDSSFIEKFKAGVVIEEKIKELESAGLCVNVFSTIKDGTNKICFKMTNRVEDNYYFYVDFF